MTNQIIAVINQKGGTGKTTLALNLAAGLSRRGATHLVDADPQRSITQWVGMGGGNSGLPGVAQLGGNPTAVLNKLVRNYRYVVVDCPPTVQGEAVAAIMRMAHLALIPVLHACLVLNQLESRNALSRDMREAVAEFDVPVLASGMQRRAAYRTAAVEGVSVYGVGKRGQQAVADIEAIIEEVLCL